MTHSFWLLLYVQLVSFFYHCSHSTYIRAQVTVHFIHSTSPLFPISTYLAPSSCDRNGPPQSQVARKLSPLSPIAPVYPSLPQLPSLLGFPGPNVLLIRTHPNPFPSIRHNNNCTLNSEIKARWRCCLGEIGIETQERAVTRGLWSVQSWKT